MNIKKEKEKNNSFSQYFKILYNERINREIRSKRFLIYFLRAFALDEKVVETVIRDIFGKQNETMIDINKLTDENQVPTIFSKYISGNRALAVSLVTACSERRSKTNNVRSRIKHFLDNNIAKEKQDLVVNQIQELFKKLDLPDKTLSELDQLMQNTKKWDYFCQTFQIVLSAQYKKSEHALKTKEIFDSSLIEEEALIDNNKNEIASHIKDTLSDEAKNQVTTQNEPLATISGWDGSTTALDVLLRPLPRSMQDAVQELRNRQRKENP